MFFNENTYYLFPSNSKTLMFEYILEVNSASISHEKHRKDEADHIKSIKSLLANSVAYIKDNLNVLDASVQDVIRKIDSNQASIVDLSKYHKCN